MTCTTKTHGKPPVNTPVRPLKNGSSPMPAFYADQTCYVAGYTNTNMCGPDRIVVSTEEGSYHGNFCTEWESINPLDNLSDEEKKIVADAALDAAKKRGYCDETKKILKDLGLISNTRTVTVELTVEEEEGSKFNHRLLSYNGGGAVKVKEIKEIS